MGYQEDNRVAWETFEKEVLAKHGSVFPPLISAVRDRDPERVFLCLLLCEDKNGLASKIPGNNGRVAGRWILGSDNFLG